MRLGKTGINIYFLAALSFIFAIFGWGTLGALLLAYVVIIEKDKWLTKQVLEAFVIQLIAAGIKVVIETGKSVITNIWSVNTSTYYSDYYYTGGVIYRVFNGILTWGGFLINIVLFILLLLGLLNVIKGKEANTPIFSTITNWALGIVKPRPVYQQPPVNNQYQYQSQNQNQYQSQNQNQYQNQYQGQAQNQYQGQDQKQYQGKDQNQYQSPKQQPKPFGKVYQQGERSSQNQNQNSSTPPPPAPPVQPTSPPSDSNYPSV